MIGFISPKSLCWNTTFGLWLAQKQNGSTRQAKYDRSSAKSTWTDCSEGCFLAELDGQPCWMCSSLGSFGSEPTEAHCSPHLQWHHLSASLIQSHSLNYLHAIWPVGLWCMCCIPLYSLKSICVKNNSKFLSFSCTCKSKNNFELKTQHSPLSLAPLAGAFASSVPYPGVCGNHPQFSLGAAAFLASPWAGWPQPHPGVLTGCCTHEEGAHCSTETFMELLSWHSTIPYSYPELPVQPMT